MTVNMTVFTSDLLFTIKSSREGVTPSQCRRSALLGYSTNKQHLYSTLTKQEDNVDAERTTSTPGGRRQRQSELKSTPE